MFNVLKHQILAAQNISPMPGSVVKAMIRPTKCMMIAKIPSD